MKRQSPIKYELLGINHIENMMHKKKLFTLYFEGVLRCNRISDAYSGLNFRVVLKVGFVIANVVNKSLERFAITEIINMYFLLVLMMF